MQTAECLITFLGIVLLPALWHEQRNQECRPPTPPPEGPTVCICRMESL